ncbi:MAG: FHA domain-containing protein [Archangiaceae bacterium]|nr:FHA domain-containing protein [Archangiaceae bacterium]
MATASFGFSILQRQRQLLGPRFAERYPHDWLIWEAGPWRPATTRAARDTESTRLPDSAGPARPVGEDFLCFVLDESRSPVHVGRATTNDIAINDLTASRDQFVFDFEHGRWWVRSLQPGALLDGADLGEQRMAIASQSRLTVGAVFLTFLSSADLIRRLATAESAQPAL